MIVKIQKPLAPPPPDGMALIYNRARTVVHEVAWPEVSGLFRNGELKVYHTARLRGTLLHIGKRTSEQDW